MLDRCIRALRPLNQLVEQFAVQPAQTETLHGTPRHELWLVFEGQIVQKATLQARGEGLEIRGRGLVRVPKELLETPHVGVRFRIEHERVRVGPEVASASGGQRASEAVHGPAKAAPRVGGPREEEAAELIPADRSPEHTQVGE